MNIICATDDNFVQHCSVMLASVLVNNEDVIVWLLSEGLTENNYSILKTEVESKGGIFNYVEVNSKIISKLPMPDHASFSHISPATYYRLLVSEILPLTVHKAIYLDCDIVVRGSLKELWKTEIQDCALGAVHQMWQEIEGAHRLNYPVKYGYFNAGVLLVNLDYWRQHDVSAKVVDYLITHYETIRMHDQDALNAVLHDKTYRLPCKWNMLHFFFLPYAKTITGRFEGRLVLDFADYKSQLKFNRKDPRVVHYVSKPKPWQQGCVHPFVKQYFFYAKKTVSFNNIREPNWAKTKLNISAYNLTATLKWITHPVYLALFRKKQLSTCIEQ
ncbi:MAG: glycosyltransferase family 8 protein [Bacteroidota bacterium]